MWKKPLPPESGTNLVKYSAYESSQPGVDSLEDDVARMDHQVKSMRQTMSDMNTNVNEMACTVRSTTCLLGLFGVIILLMVAFIALEVERLSSAVTGPGGLEQTLDEGLTALEDKVDALPEQLRAIADDIRQNSAAENSQRD